MVVVEENHSASVLRNPASRYLRHLARNGANLTQFHAETHPSQPNYVALFSGYTRGLHDGCPHRFTARNLAHQLRVHGLSFAGYSENLPRQGYRGCADGGYLRRHAPWTNFANVSRTANRPFTAFPSDYATLPTVSFVIPNVYHDMHDGTPAQADRWLRNRLGRYANWATAHRSLLVVTFDESDYTRGNRVPTIAVGYGVRRGRSSQRVDHYSLLRTIEDGLRLPPLGHARSAQPITALG